MTEPSESRLSLRQADAARADLYAIHDELELIKLQLAWLPTRIDVARLVVLSGLAAAALAVTRVALLMRL
jgi:hypothetical protein